MSRHIPSCHPLGEQISELAAPLNGATCALIELIGRFETEKGWAQDGCRSCAHWLNWKCGIGLVAAREKVRVAAALDGLPQVHAAFAKGELSYSKVRAMTRVATPESEDYLMMIARHGTAAHVETVVRGYRRIERRAELQQCNEAYAGRSLHWRYDEDGSTVFLLRLPPEDEQRFYQAVEARREALQAERGDEAGDSAESPLRATRADALMDLITRGHDTEVVVHVPAESLADEGGEGQCHLEDGPTVPPETARRMACDAGVVRLVEGPDGLPLDLGRKTRSIPPALRRALKARDAGCRFPGCDSTRHVQGHHVKHWARGGKTALTNLVLLCVHHHRAVHEGGFTVQPDSAGTFHFHRPDGQRMVSTPPCNTVDGDPATLLRNRHDQRGIHIDAGTAVPHWDGLPMDDGMAVEGLLQASGKLDEWG